MRKKQHVVPAGDKWGIKSEGNSRLTSTFDRQSDAIVDSVVAIWAFLINQALLAIVFLLMLIILIERAIHTTYTLSTDGKVIIYNERFM